MILFGDKTVAFLDVWSLEHFVTGICISHVSAYLGALLFKGGASHYNAAEVSKNPREWLVYILLVACIWEVIEFYMEAGYTGIDGVTYWFQGVEFWANRLISDPILVIVGGYLGLKHKKLVIYARCFSIVWLFVHIFVFPHSMYLHELMGLE
ncbi:MAG: hypothetical protein MK137_10210 [Rickettsiales bacterium]|nr:hypothetical protein [Rickettsiales bacterium]